MRRRACRESYRIVGALAAVVSLKSSSKSSGGFNEAFQCLDRPLLDNQSTLCEATIPSQSPPPKPSWFRRSLASIYLASLPVPRTLIKQDPAFEDAALKRGLRQRKKDERTLRGMQDEIHQLHQIRDPEKLKRAFAKVTEVAYGKGVTPQMRENFVIRYGCTGWTDEVLEYLVELADGRGFVEVGAGNGQWARALTDYYRQAVIDQPAAFEFVLAYDDMTELPLSPQVYHKHTQPAHDYFYSRVKKCTDGVASIFRQWSCRGRVLLLVYPPSNGMALDTVKAYVSMGSENDTVVYVGEGRGGSTANNDLFDYLEEEEWVLVRVMQVQSQPGAKGYEKLFILRRPGAGT